jgi:hypothetical protein
MKPRNIILALLGLLLLGGCIWYSGLDKETRGLLSALPTDRDVLSWGQGQREAAFRAMDRLPLLDEASPVTPSTSPSMPTSASDAREGAALGSRQSFKMFPARARELARPI